MPTTRPRRPCDGRRSPAALLRRAVLGLALAVPAAWVGPALAANSSAAAPAGNEQHIVRTGAGAVRGVLRHGVVEYRGIPYAAAPTGARRFAAPVAAPAWAGVRDASRFGPACPQQARFNLTEGSENEDCLSLNVSVPEDARPGAKLPVLFWIHGGAFVGGGSNLYRLDKLAREGRMVVVSVNYRLGMLGFMPHPGFESARHLNGNYGLEDQRLAMRWVQRHIAAFGGDPRRVTIAGESAGAGSVCMHLASPERVKGLFHQAVVQSAGCLQPMKTVAEAEAVGRSIGQALGCGGAAAEAARCMRRKPVAELLVQQGRYAAEHPADFTPFAPVVGTPERPNAALPRSVRAAVDSHRLVSVPLLMGGTRHEVRLYVGYWWQGALAGHNPPVDANNLPGWLEPFYGKEHTAAILQRYTPAGGWPSSAAVAETLGAMMSDYNPRIPINNCLYQHTAQVFTAEFRRRGNPPPIWQFEFADEDAPVLGVGIGRPDPDFRLGSVHSSELNYLFPNLSNTQRIDAPDLAPASQQLADQMVAWWAAFVHRGDPNVKGLPNWPVYDGGATVLRMAPGQVAAYDADSHHQCTSFWRTRFQMP